MSTPTPQTDSEEYPEGEGQSFHVVSADFARTLERELATERAKVKALREACESICEEWGAYHAAPFLAGSNMEKHATAALAATEDAQ